MVRLGLVADLKRPESFISDQAVLVRYDSSGFSVMSLMCSYDLSILKVALRDGRQILTSPNSESSYELDGTILTGPTKFPLPYYELEIAPGVNGGPADTLYAKISVEKPKQWRLMAP